MSNILQIAARIQSRIVQLTEENEKLKGADQLVETLEADFVQETERSRNVHSRYLEHLIERNSLELECCEVVKQIAEKEIKAKKLLAQKEELQQKIEAEKLQWHNKFEGSLVRHQVRLELYQKHLLGTIKRRERATGKRQHRLETASRMTSDLDQERRGMLRQQEQFQANMMRMTEEEDQDNRQVEQLASRVREALAKVRHDEKYFSRGFAVYVLWKPHNSLSNRVCASYPTQLGGIRCSDPNCEHLFERRNMPTRMPTMKPISLPMSIVVVRGELD
jgi:hypothetical protein